jgi:hypothetical protein
VSPWLLWLESWLSFSSCYHLGREPAGSVHGSWVMVVTSELIHGGYLADLAGAPEVTLNLEVGGLTAQVPPIGPTSRLLCTPNSLFLLWSFVLPLLKSTD